MRAHCNEKKAGTVNRTSSSWLCAKTEKEVNKVQQNFRIFFFFHICREHQALQIKGKCTNLH